MTILNRDNWTFGAQIITATGVLVITVFAFVNQINQEFRDEVRSDFAYLRTELAVLRTEFVSMREEMHEEMHDMNTRLGRVEGYLRISSDQ